MKLDPNSILDEIESHLPRPFPKAYRTHMSSLEVEEDEYCFPIRPPNPLANNGLGYLLSLEKIEYYDSDISFLRIGDDLSGNGIYMSFRRSDHGSVWFFDCQQRECWSDERFYEMFSDLDEKIKAYLADRKAGRHPEKEENMYSYFPIADSFEEFLEIREPFVLD